MVSEVPPGRAWRASRRGRAQEQRRHGDGDGDGRAGERPALAAHPGSRRAPPRRATAATTVVTHDAAEPWSKPSQSEQHDGEHRRAGAEPVPRAGGRRRGSSPSVFSAMKNAPWVRNSADGDQPAEQRSSG